MRARENASYSANATCGLVHSRVNGALIKAFCQDSKQLGEAAEATNKTVPDITTHKIPKPVREITIKKIRKRGRQFRRPHYEMGIELIDPHLVLEETEHSGQRLLQR